MVTQVFLAKPTGHMDAALQVQIAPNLGAVNDIGIGNGNGAVTDLSVFWALA